MMYKFICTIPDSHKEYTGVRSIEMEVAQDATRDEMCEAFEQFLQASGYSFREGEHIGYEWEDGCLEKAQNQDL